MMKKRVEQSRTNVEQTIKLISRLDSSGTAPYKLQSIVREKGGVKNSYPSFKSEIANGGGLHASSLPKFQSTVRGEGGVYKIFEVVYKIVQNVYKCIIKGKENFLIHKTSTVLPKIFFYSYYLNFCVSNHKIS